MDNVSELEQMKKLNVNIISLELSESLISLAKSPSGQLQSKINELRKKLTINLGYVIPQIKLFRNSKLQNNEYVIKVRDDIVLKDVVDIEKMQPEDVITQNLQKICLQYTNKIIDYDFILRLYKYIEETFPEYWLQIKTNLPDIAIIRDILANLIHEKVSVKDIKFVLEKICDFYKHSHDARILSERMRAEMSRQICLNYINSNNILNVITLSPELEKLLDNSMQKTEIGVFFMLKPEQVQNLVETTITTLNKVYQQIGEQTVLVCTPRIRGALFSLLEQHIPSITVLAYSELLTDIKVVSIDTITSNL